MPFRTFGGRLTSDERIFWLLLPSLPSFSFCNEDLIPALEPEEELWSASSRLFPVFPLRRKSLRWVCKNLFRTSNARFIQLEVHKRWWRENGVIKTTFSWTHILRKWVCKKLRCTSNAQLEVGNKRWNFHLLIKEAVERTSKKTWKRERRTDQKGEELRGRKNRHTKWCSMRSMDCKRCVS